MRNNKNIKKHYRVLSVFFLITCLLLTGILSACGKKSESGPADQSSAIQTSLEHQESEAPVIESGEDTTKDTQTSTNQKDVESESTSISQEETSKAPAKETSKAPAKETTKVPVKETTKAPAKESSKAPEKESTKAPAKETTKPPIKETSAKESSKAPETTKAPQTTKAPESKANTCTISISCKTILSNMDKLKESKKEFVPSNGVILGQTTVEFSDGDTVYDVLKKICKSKKIQIEANYSPMYSAYYVEGIGHLYEFDCGPNSGWTYRVNGEYPNYGCSKFEVKPGDKIEWLYTCE